MFPIVPILYFLPFPFPICKDIAPFPLVFQGIFGFNLTSLGKPIISRLFSTRDSIRAKAKKVVQPPFVESVSSIPIQIFLRS